jgi:hypothetical protein
MTRESSPQPVRRRVAPSTGVIAAFRCSAAVPDLSDAFEGLGGGWVYDSAWAQDAGASDAADNVLLDVTVGFRKDFETDDMRAVAADAPSRDVTDVGFPTFWWDGVIMNRRPGSSLSSSTPLRSQPTPGRRRRFTGGHQWVQSCRRRSRSTRAASAS